MKLYNIFINLVLVCFHVIISTADPEPEESVDNVNQEGIAGPIGPCETLCGPLDDPVCAYDCANKCFKTYKNNCELSGYNRCRKPYEPEHTFLHKGICNPQLPACDYRCTQTYDLVCIFDLRTNCFRTVWDECNWISYNCNKYYTVFISFGECNPKLCKLCDNECNNYY